jgi:hypothetical protein
MYQVDQAVVSLVDKEAMRAKQLKISEILKVWLKASSAERTFFLSVCFFEIFLKRCLIVYL